MYLMAGERRALAPLAARSNCVGKWRSGPAGVEFLLTKARLSDADVAQGYALRNWVEVLLRRREGRAHARGLAGALRGRLRAALVSGLPGAHARDVPPDGGELLVAGRRKGVASFRAGARVIRSPLELALLAWLRFKKHREVFMDMLGVVCAREDSYPCLATVRI